MRPSLALLAGSVAAAGSDKCTEGLQVFVGRGSGEPAGVGLSSVFADGIAKKIKNTKITPIVYPATLSDPSYFESVQDGTKAVIKAVNDYAKQCPKGKIAYLGYSQGAQIGSEAFCGPSNAQLFGDATAVSADVVHDNVVAIVLYGDPSHIVDAKYDRGTSKNDGIFPRTSEGNCKDYADKIESYCDAGDYYCDSGKNHTVHGLYFTRYPTQIVDFVVKQFNSANGAKPASNSTGGSNPSNGSGSGSNSTSGDNGKGGNSDGKNGQDGKSGNEGKKSAASGLTAAKGLLVAAPLAAMAVLL